MDKICECGLICPEYLFIKCEADDCQKSICHECYGNNPICNDCSDIQKVTTLISTTKNCSISGCKNQASVDQLCIVPCKNMIVLCKSHATRCLKCLKDKNLHPNVTYLCQSCRLICKKHGRPCHKCKTVTLFERFYKCEVCNIDLCVECRNEYYSLDITSRVCRSHAKRCELCSRLKYKVSEFKCHTPGCLDFACLHPICKFKSFKSPELTSHKSNKSRSNKFIPDKSSPNVNYLYACHMHTDQCIWCKLTYPSVKKRLIKSIPNMYCCVNCAERLLVALDSIKMMSKRINIRIPRDVLNILILLIVRTNSSV